MSFFIAAVALDASVTRIRNPIEAETLQEFLLRLINVAIVFAVPLLALMIVIAGFLYATGGGNKEKIEKAGKMIKYGIIGFLIIVLAWVIVSVLQGIVEPRGRDGGRDGRQAPIPRGVHPI
jgi:surface polysaccharide O-acyltransferase-like enzyme